MACICFAITKATYLEILLSIFRLGSFLKITFHGILPFSLHLEWASHENFFFKKKFPGRRLGGRYLLILH